MIIKFFTYVTKTSFENGHMMTEMTKPTEESLDHFLVCSPSLIKGKNCRCYFSNCLSVGITILLKVSHFICYRCHIPYMMSFKDTQHQQTLS